MEKNEDVIYHQYLIRLDDELSRKMVQFTKENDMKLTGLIRKSLRQFFKNEELKEQTKPVKNNDQKDER
jgi:predicted transcriptional regulator